MFYNCLTCYYSRIANANRSRYSVESIDLLLSLPKLSADPLNEAKEFKLPLPLPLMCVSLRIMINYKQSIIDRSRFGRMNQGLLDYRSCLLLLIVFFADRTSAKRAVVERRWAARTIKDTNHAWWAA
jgi:hypothetical protein